MALSPSKLTTVAQVMFSDSTFWLFAIFDSISEWLSPLLEDGGVSRASFAFRSLGGDMLHSSRAVWGKVEELLRLAAEDSTLLAESAWPLIGCPSTELFGNLTACFSNCGGDGDLREFLV